MLQVTGIVRKSSTLRRLLRSAKMVMVRWLKLPIVIKDQAWVCADAFVGPGVIVGEGAIVGARAVVMKNVEPWNIVAGNPAKMIKKRILSNERQAAAI
jgi:acetyltransferase-like isoleucine patch superfamily enzyme